MNNTPGHTHHDWRTSLKNVLQTPLVWVILFSVAFSSWLMFHTFSYNGKTHEIIIAYKIWSDFGAHIPLIRSFSLGENLPRVLHGIMPEYPIFPGEPIKYHYFFYMVVGVLEKLGLRIDWALNLPSIIGFSILLCSLYMLAKKITGSMTTAILTVIFFLFNGSLGFLRFFSLHPLSGHTLSDIIHAKDFPAFAPWGPGEVTAFWNLNIYTNQRHLAPAFAIAVLFILCCMHVRSLTVKKQIPWIIAWGIIFGLLPYFHQPTLLIVAIIMATYGICIPKLRYFILATGVLTTILVVPQILMARGASNPAEWYPGYIIHNEFMKEHALAMVYHLASFWWQNLGLHSVLIIIGFFIIPRATRVYLLPMIPLFIIPNLFKFSIEASANHKFFNFFLALGGILSAHTITSLFKEVTRFTMTRMLRTPHHRHIWEGIGGFAYACIGTSVLFLILSGVIDFFVITNDIRGKITDVPTNEIAQWIDKNTAKSAVFLNSSYLYHPASIAGRAIFLGWPYFAWSAGYQENRMTIMDEAYESKNSHMLCSVLKKYAISFVTVENVKNDANLPDIDLSYYLKTYTPSFITKDKRYAIFSTLSLCANP